jgi:hypothetical protein
MSSALRIPSNTAIAFLVLGASTALAAEPDWSAVPSQTVQLFYPGQSSLEWLMSQDHPGAAPVTQGVSCVTCHEGKEAEKGQKIVSGEILEPAPIEGKVGAIEVTFQAAYDEENLYLRFQWPTQFDRPGQMHDYIRYTGEGWEFYGGPRSRGTVRAGEVPPLYEDRLSIMIDDGSVPNFAQQGCWLTCHTSMRDMPEAPSSDAVKAHPFFGEKLGESDIRKYLPGSRTGDSLAWDAPKSEEEIAELKEQGQFLELMQWRAHRSNPVNMADDGYVLEYRLFDEGKNPFSWNVDRKTMIPKFMFDEAKVGMKAITVDDIGDVSKPYAMIREENAAPYDPEAGWQEGDVLPGRLLSREDAKDSAADNDDVRGTWENSVWTVTWTRPLDTGNADDKALSEGNVYNIGLAVHDDNVTTRFHFVSFPFTLGIGTDADVKAEPVK